MSKKHPTPWKDDINDADEPIKDANGERIFATDDGFLGPDDDTIREIVVAVNERDELLREMNGVREAARKVVADWQTALDERDKLKAECDRLRTAYADLWRAVKRIEADSRLGLGTGLEVASSALHYVHTYASSAIRAAEKKGFAPEIGKDKQ